LEAIAKFSHDKYERCFVRSLGWYESGESIFIAMEYFPYGDFEQYLSSPLMETEVQEITFQLSEGIAFMHENGFAHRDLKPRNILVKSKGPDWWVKIGDFGISKRAEEEVTALRTLNGTPGFMAPEILVRLGLLDLDNLDVGDQYTVAVDIWSLGEIAFRALTGESPFPITRLGPYVRGKTEFPVHVLQIHSISSDGCNFVRSLMAPLPKDRLTAKDAMSHAWFESQRPSSARSSLEVQSSGLFFQGDTASTYQKIEDASAAWSTLTDSTNAATMLSATRESVQSDLSTLSSTVFFGKHGPDTGPSLTDIQTLPAASARESQDIIQSPESASLQVSQEDTIQTPQNKENIDNAAPPNMAPPIAEDTGPVSKYLDSMGSRPDGQPLRDVTQAERSEPNVGTLSKLAEYDATSPAIPIDMLSQSPSPSDSPVIIDTGESQSSSLYHQAVEVSKPDATSLYQQAVERLRSKPLTTNLYQQAVERSEPAASNLFQQAADSLYHQAVELPKSAGVFERGTSKIRESESDNTSNRARHLNNAESTMETNPMLSSAYDVEHFPGRENSVPSDSSVIRKHNRFHFGNYILGKTIRCHPTREVKIKTARHRDVTGGPIVEILLYRRDVAFESLNNIYRLAGSYSRMRHDNLQRLREWIETEQHIGLVLEYPRGVDLSYYISKQPQSRIEDRMARTLFRELVSAVGYLHSNGIFHLDINLETILLNKSGKIVLTSSLYCTTFDLKDELSEGTERNVDTFDYVTGGGRCGSKFYAAPETVISADTYSGRKADVWSCGVVLYAMLAGYLPFNDDLNNLEGDNISLLYKYMLSSPLTFPQCTIYLQRDLLRRILVPYTRKRADLSEVMEHKWLHPADVGVTDVVPPDSKQGPAQSEKILPPVWSSRDMGDLKRPSPVPAISMPTLRRPFQVKALRGYHSYAPDDLNFIAGQIISVQAELDEDWYHGEYNTEFLKLSGKFPRSCVEVYYPRQVAQPRLGAQRTPGRPSTSSEQKANPTAQDDLNSGRGYRVIRREPHRISLSQSTLLSGNQSIATSTPPTLNAEARVVDSPLKHHRKHPEPPVVNLVPPIPAEQSYEAIQPTQRLYSPEDNAHIESVIKRAENLLKKTERRPAEEREKTREESKKARDSTQFKSVTIEGYPVGGSSIRRRHGEERSPSHESEDKEMGSPNPDYKKPVYLKGLFSVSTTSSKPLSFIRADITRILDGLGVNYHEIQGGYEIKTARLDFEILIVKKVPLLQLHGIQFKKLRGETMHYKDMAQCILEELRV
jgi:calcium/calmodulin-dependent protein kinase I